MTDIDRAIYALECCIESDETCECPPGCPFGGEFECEMKAKMLARDVLKARRASISGRRRICPRE